MAMKPLNVKIGARIKFSREQAGLTQEQLAEKINRSTQFVSTIERGAAGPSLETVIALCEVLNTSSEWLLRGLHQTSTAETIAAKLSVLSGEQLAIVDRMASDLLRLLNTEKNGETR